MYFNFAKNFSEISYQFESFSIFFRDIIYIKTKLPMFLSKAENFRKFGEIFVLSLIIKILKYYKFE